MALTSYAQVQAFISSVLKQNQEYAGVAGAPHKDFWNTMSYLQFTTGNVPGPGVTDRNGHPVRILVPGDSANSGLIQVLRGTGIADPNTGDFDRMPANANIPLGKPYFTDVQIQEIADWIDANCPQ